MGCVLGDRDPDAEPDRRRFLELVTAAAATAMAAIPTIPALLHFLRPEERRLPRIWRTVGMVDDFEVDETVDVKMPDPRALPWAGFAAESAVLLRKTGPESFIAFSPYCTHVGCPVRWDRGSQLFLCPCHGGAFYPDGVVAAGPPPSPLERHQVRVRNGAVQVRFRPIRLKA